MTHILGAGIAGLTLALALEKRRQPWCIYEKAAVAGCEASGKNAGIIRTYETDPVIRHFAEASLQYYRAEEPSFKQCGIILRPWDVDYGEKPAPQREFSHRRCSGSFFSENGTIEPERLLQRLTSAVYNYGKIVYNFEGTIKTEGQRVSSLGTESDSVFLKERDVLVVACGEGVIPLAIKLDRPLTLIAHRRTLYEYQNSMGLDGPVEWDEETGVYFRVSAGGATLTATSGEQIPTEARASLGSDDDEKYLSIIEREFPFLTRETLLAQRTCKRLTSLDNRPFAGRDATFANLFWFTGLGGRGISIAPALAEALADSILGAKDSTRILDRFSPMRGLS